MSDADRAATGRPGLVADPAPVPGTPSRRWLSLPMRLIVVVSLTIGLVYFGIVSPFRSVIILNINREAEGMLREQVRVLQALAPNDRAMVEKALSAMPLGVFSMQIFGTNGAAKVRAGPLAGELPLPQAFTSATGPRSGAILEDVTTRSAQRVRVLTTWLETTGSGGGEPLVLQLGLSLEEKYQRLRALMGWLATGGFLLVVLPAAAIYLITTQWRRQFRDFCGQADQIRLGSPPHPRLPVSSAERELRELAQAMNRLIGQMEKSYVVQQRFIADASHELRTPLTIVRGELDVILRRDRAASEYRDVLQSNREEVEKLSKLVDNMLTLALADAHEATPPKRVVNLGSVAEAACKRLQPMAVERSVSLKCAGQADCEVLGESADLERAILNLVENALHFSPKGDAVILTVTADRKFGFVSVTDRGPGIAPEQVTQIFDRFYRVDKSHSRSHGGAGLGLAIVKTIAEAHGGTVEVESRLGMGSTFRLRIPLRAGN